MNNGGRSGLFGEMPEQSIDLGGGFDYATGQSLIGSPDPSTARPAGGRMAVPVQKGQLARGAGYGILRVPGAPAGAAPATPGTGAPTGTPAMPQTMRLGYGQSSKSRRIVDPALQGQYGTTIAAQQGAGQGLEQAQLDIAKGRRGVYEESEEKKAAKYKMFDDQRKKLRADLAPEEAKMLSLGDEVAQGKVDPDKFWSDRTTGQKIALTLGTMLGAFAEGLSGGKVRNAALAMMDKAIDRDIAAQVQNLRGKERQLGAQRGLVSYLYGKVGDVDRAQQMARVMMNDWTDSKLRAVEQEHAGTIIAKQAEMARLQNKSNQLMSMMQLTATTKTSGGGYKTAVVKPPSGSSELERLKIEKMKRGSVAQQKEAMGALKSFGNLMEYMPRVLAAKKASPTGQGIGPITKDPVSGFQAYFGIGDTGAMYKELKRHGMQLVKQLSGVQNREREQKVIEAALPQAGDTESQIRVKLRTLIEGSGRNALANYQQAMTLGNTVLAKAWLNNYSAANASAREHGLPQVKGLPGGANLWLSAPMTNARSLVAGQEK